MVADDEALKRLFALDSPPDRDFEFELKVLARMQGRRWLRDVAEWAGLGLISAVLLWAAGPWLVDALRAGIRSLDGAAPIVLGLIAVAAAVGLGWVTPGVLKPGLRRINHEFISLFASEQASQRLFRAEQAAISCFQVGIEGARAMETLAGEMVPIMGILMIVAVVVGPIWISSFFKNRERQRLHETLRLMVEKGQPVSGDLLETLNADGKPRKTPNDMRRGVILTAIGIGLATCGLVAGLTGDGDAVGPLLGLGAFPGFIGLGFVVLALLSRDRAKD